MALVTEADIPLPILKPGSANANAYIYMYKPTKMG